VEPKMSGRFWHFCRHKSAKKEQPNDSENEWDLLADVRSRKVTPTVDEVKPKHSLIYNEKDVKPKGLSSFFLL